MQNPMINNFPHSLIAFFSVSVCLCLSRLLSETPFSLALSMSALLCCCLSVSQNQTLSAATAIILQQQTYKIHKIMNSINPPLPSSFKTLYLLPEDTVFRNFE